MFFLLLILSPGEIISQCLNADSLHTNNITYDNNNATTYNPTYNSIYTHTTNANHKNNNTNTGEA